jgi:hypothetical protein
MRSADTPATDEEVRAATLQFVRKISGYRKPLQVNILAFDSSIDEIALTSRHLLASRATAVAR